MDTLTTVSEQTLSTVQAFSADMFNDFLFGLNENTARSYAINLRQFAAWLKYAGVVRPGRNDIIIYRQWLLEEHDAIVYAPDTAAGWTYRTDGSGNPVKVNCKPNTVKQYLQVVKMFFAWTAANGLYPNIAANIRAPKVTQSHKKDSLTPAEVLAIETSISERATIRTAAAEQSCKDTAGRVQRSTEQGKRLYAMYLLAVNAGLRTVEISRANIKDLETKGGRTYLYIWGKGHTEADQRKPIAAEVMAAINDYLNSRTDRPTGNSPLFVSTGNRSKGKRIAATTISKMLKQAMQQAGFNSERITAHSLRHTTGQNVMDITGSNIYKTQQYMRHSSPTTTEIYLENNNAEQDAEIAEQLYNRYHGNDNANDQAEKLQSIIAMLNPQQLAQLAGIAEAIAK